MLAQYKAVEKFLTSTIKASQMDPAALSHLQTTQTQQMKAALARMTFDLDDAAMLQEELSKPTVAFTSEQCRDMAATVSRLAGNTTLTNPKAKLQECFGFMHMMTDVQWDELSAMPDIGCRIQIVVRSMLQIGLRNPSEPTKRTILVMLMMCNDGPPLQLCPTDFYKWLQKMTEGVTRMRKNPVYPEAPMLRFPPDGAELMRTHPHLFLHGTPVASRIAQVDIERRVSMYGTRSTMRGLNIDTPVPDQNVAVTGGGWPMAGPRTPADFAACMLQFGQMMQAQTASSSHLGERDVIRIMGNRSGANRPARASPDPMTRPAICNTEGDDNASQSTADISAAHAIPAAILDGSVHATPHDAAPPTDDAIDGLVAVRKQLADALLSKAADQAQQKADTAKKKREDAKMKAAMAAKATSTPPSKASSKAASAKSAPSSTRTMVAAPAKAKAVAGKSSAAAKAAAPPPKRRLILGCAKCRYVTQGCGQCRDPNFSGKRGKH